MIYHFGDCAYDAARGELRRAGELVRAEPQALRVLLYLLEHRDRLVSRDELFDRCWPDAYVSDNALTICLRRVRRAIGQTNSGQHFIQTLHRRGYRFVGEVSEIAEPAAPDADLTASPLSPAQAPEPDRPLMLGVEPIPSDASSPSPSPAITESDVAPERRHLTVLRCVIYDAETLASQLDPEDHYDLMQAFHSRCGELVSQYEGRVVQQRDDGIMVYFGYPQAHEDDAQRAVHSGLGLVETLGRLVPAGGSRGQAGLRVRVGIDTGIVIVSSPQSEPTTLSLAVGSAATYAPKLADLAEPGSVVISESTARLVHGYFDYKAVAFPSSSGHGPGIGESVGGYEVLGVSGLQTRLEVEVVRGFTPFVGREVEVALLRERWESVQEGQGQAVLIRGEAGMGKSRLAQVFKAQVAEGPSESLEWRCSPYHQNTPFYPLINVTQQVLARQAAVSEADSLETLERWLARFPFALSETAPLMAALLSVPLPPARYAPLQMTPQRQRERTLEMLLSLFLTQSTEEPMVFIVEDLHWADPSTLDFLELLLSQVPSMSILVILTCRPSFEAPWMFRSELTPVALPRLNRAQMTEMIAQVAGGKGFSAEVTAQLAEKADGVPLFVEELTRMMIESGQFQETDAGYALTGEVASLSIPATLQDSLMARLDRLGAAKTIAQWGAVCGREFSYDLVLAVTSYDEAELRQGLSQLVESDLAFQRGLLPQVDYRFKHALIQDTAYASLSRRRRQAMHKQVAQVLAGQFPERVENQPELLAHHYTEAGLIEPALPHWKRSVERAIKSSANREAQQFLLTMLELLATLPEDTDRQLQELEVQMLLGPLLMSTKGLASPDVQQTYARAYELCQEIGDMPYLYPTLWGLWRFYLSRPQFAQARQIAEQIFTLAERAEDTGLRLQAHVALGNTVSYQGELAAGKGHFERALELYDVMQHRALSQWYGGIDPEVFCLAAMSSVLWRLGFPEQAMVRSQRALALARELENPSTLAYALNFASVVHVLRREPERAEAAAAELLALAEDHGMALWRSNSTIMQGWALSMLGRIETGISQLRAGIAAHTATGAELSLPFWYCLLVEAYQRQDCVSDGLAMVAEMSAVIQRTGEHPMETTMHRLHGELLLLQPDSDKSQAAALFESALASARQQEGKSLELRAAMSLARLWSQQGQRQAAKALLAPLYAWFTEGFDTADLKTAKALLETLGV